MVQDIHLHVPEHLLDEAERLVPVLKRDPELAVMGRVNRAVVLRLALQQGLEVLKQRYTSASNSLQKGCSVQSSPPREEMHPPWP